MGERERETPLLQSIQGRLARWTPEPRDLTVRNVTVAQTHAHSCFFLVVSTARHRHIHGTEFRNKKQGVHVRVSGAKRCLIWSNEFLSLFFISRCVFFCSVKKKGGGGRIIKRSSFLNVGGGLTLYHTTTKQVNERRHRWEREREMRSVVLQLPPSLLAHRRRESERERDIG